MRTSLVPLFVCSFAMGASLLASGAPPTIAAQARSSRKVVVARVADVRSRFDTNKYGDRLIVSDVWLEVEETLKGTAAGGMQATVEGGTVGELTLTVSDMPVLEPGDRAVFFLDEQPSGRHVPHGRGFGILEIDGAGRVAHQAQTLDDVRRAVRAAVR